MTKVYHSTVTCPECGYDSYKSVNDIIYGDNKCFHCGADLSNTGKKK